ncbi:MAG: hypothetical protein Q9160_003657 [Pyrenula sp. 1 TL-2023]
MTEHQVNYALRSLNAGVLDTAISSDAFEDIFDTLVEASRDSVRRREVCIPSALEACCKILERGTSEPGRFRSYLETIIIFLNNSCPDDGSVEDLDANKNTIIHFNGLATLFSLLQSQESPLWEKVLSALNNICFDYERAEAVLAAPHSHAVQILSHLALAQQSIFEAQANQQDDLCNLIETAGEHWESYYTIPEADYVTICSAASQVKWESSNFCALARFCVKVLPSVKVSERSQDTLKSIFSLARSSFQHFNGTLVSEVSSENPNFTTDAEDATKQECRSTQNDLLEKLYEVAQGKLEGPKPSVSWYVQLFLKDSDEPSVVCACYTLCGFVLQRESEIMDHHIGHELIENITKKLAADTNTQGIRAHLQLIGLLAMSAASSYREIIVQARTLSIIARFFEGRAKIFLDSQINGAITARKVMIESTSAVLQFFGLEECDGNYRVESSQRSSGRSMVELWEETDNTDLKVEIARVVAQICRTLKRMPQFAVALEAIFELFGDETHVLNPVAFVICHHPSEAARIEGWMAIGILTEVLKGRSALCKTIIRNTNFREKMLQTARTTTGYERENLKVVLAHLQNDVSEARVYLDQAARSLNFNLGSSTNALS